MAFLLSWRYTQSTVIVTRQQEDNKMGPSELLEKQIEIDELLEKQIGIILEEYKISCNGTDKYFDYLYRTIQFFLMALAAIFVYSLKEAAGFAYEFLFMLIVPMIGYIFGLFYCYNGYSIAKHALFQKECEEKIKILTKIAYRNNGFRGWTHFVTQKRDGFLLPYGTLLMFFVLMPAACIFLSFQDIRAVPFAFTFRIPPTFSSVPLLILSVAFYAVFLVFMAVIIAQTWSLLKKVEKTVVEHRLSKEKLVFNVVEDGKHKDGKHKDGKRKDGKRKSCKGKYMLFK
jgi:hypothetical protein